MTQFIHKSQPPHTHTHTPIHCQKHSAFRSNSRHFGFSSRHEVFSLCQSNGFISDKTIDAPVVYGYERVGLTHSMRPTAGIHNIGQQLIIGVSNDYGNKSKDTEKSFRPFCWLKEMCRFACRCERFRYCPDKSFFHGLGGLGQRVKWRAWKSAMNPCDIESCRCTWLNFYAL